MRQRYEARVQCHLRSRPRSIRRWRKTALAQSTGEVRIDCGVPESKDVNHPISERVWLDLASRAYEVVVTDWIIAETGNGLARTRICYLFADAVNRILNGSKVEVVVIDRPLIAKAVDHYRLHTDKVWGLVDCASFLVMEDRGISDAFTSDRHFEQAGFNCLLAE